MKNVKILIIETIKVKQTKLWCLKSLTQKEHAVFTIVLTNLVDAPISRTFSLRSQDAKKSGQFHMHLVLIVN